jgi:hypothetical protein
MVMVSKIWQFLTTDITELNWRRPTEVTKTGADAAKAVLDLAKTVKEKSGDLATAKSAISPYIGELSSLLDVLNSPIAAVVKDAIPFAPIAVTILQLICEATRQEPNREQCVALIAQAAYLESLQDAFSTDTGKALLTRLNPEEATEQVQQQIRKVGELSLDRSAAEKVITDFAGTELAKSFGVALVARLVDAGLAEAEAETWAQRVAWNTPRFFNLAVAEAKDKVKTLAELFSNGGRERLERYNSIDRYLAEKIEPLPQEMVFDETDLRFAEIYVPLQVQPLHQDGSLNKSEAPVQIEARILELLAETDPKEKLIVFIQGDAGQGKSVFCRMFSDRVRRELFPGFMPILIRLRDLRKLALNLTETLETELQNVDFVKSDRGWLTDQSQRFLFLLDGFDELLLQGGAIKNAGTGGLQEFLDQVVSFQRDSHHRFLITGRPLSLQGIDRLISQSKNLMRLALCPMQDNDRTSWLDKWGEKFGAPERNSFETFLAECPEDVSDKLAREPLLLYLLGRMHRDQAISAANLQGTSGMLSKVKFYDTVIQWVLDKQRETENQRITGLECDQLRLLLAEAALCVVQSGNETAKVSMLEARMAKDSDNPISSLIAQSRRAADVSEQKALNNLLTTFYIKPAAIDQEGSIEFVHKSFGEFLFAERLKEAIEEWSKLGERKREEYLVSDGQLHEEIYDLLGYGGLTLEITDYLMTMLEASEEWKSVVVVLFERLNNFWERWCEGEFIDAPTENLPQGKMRSLWGYTIQLSLRQVDVYAGLNILILLLRVYRYAQSQNALKRDIDFCPSGKPRVKSSTTVRLSQIIHYSDCLKLGNFVSIVGFAMDNANLSSADLRSVDFRHANLSNANLNKADLRRADLRSVDLRSANLAEANLRSAYLSSANLAEASLQQAYLSSASLIGANLTGANLSKVRLRRADCRRASFRNVDFSDANLSAADLSEADLGEANLQSIIWDQFTSWEKVKGLDTAHNVPLALKQQLNLT